MFSGGSRLATSALLALAFGWWATDGQRQEALAPLLDGGAFPDSSSAALEHVIGRWEIRAQRVQPTRPLRDPKNLRQLGQCRQLAGWLPHRLGWIHRQNFIVSGEVFPSVPGFPRSLLTAFEGEGRERVVGIGSRAKSSDRDDH